MALFQKDNINGPAGEINYKGMGKDQLVMLVQSQKSDIDVLNRKLGEAAAAVNEKNRLAQQLAELSAENDSLKTSAENLREKLIAKENELNARENELNTKAREVESAEITEVGSIAEMSFRVNGVMEAAQKAADDYLARIKEMYDAMSRDYSTYEINAKQKAETILKNANLEAEAAKTKADAIVSNANREAAVIKQNAHKEANDIWNTLQSRFDNYVAGKKQN